MLRLSGNGTEQWARHYNHYNSNGSTVSAGDIRLSTDGGVFVTGRITESSDDDLYVLKVPENGKFATGTDCPANNLIVARKSMPNAKNAAQQVQDIQGNYNYTLFTNQNEVAEQYCGEQMPASKTVDLAPKLQLYPNPANQEVVLIAPTTDAETLTVRFYDVKGSLLATYTNILSAERLTMTSPIKPKDFIS